jgi:transglutaminase-like putative cysteine protease
MRVKTFYRALRFISAIVLFFFVWTFGPIWQAVAFAAESRNASYVKREGTTRAADARLVTSGEKFDKNLESIRELVNAAAEKSNKGKEPAEIDAIKAKKAEIESIDAELKSEFAITEKRLKDAKLPQVILDRHTAFVKNYEKNLSQLKSEIDDMDKAKTASDRKAKIEQARLHLDRVKPPKKHVLLDPNKLPNRMVKAKARAPRLRKEDFEKDFPQQKNKGTKIALTSDDSSLRSLIDNEDYVRSGINPQTTINRKPILLAFNGPASDMSLPLGNGQFTPSSSDSLSGYPSLPVTISSPLMLAQVAPTRPTADDLAATAEVQFTQDIQNLAARLNYSPVKIFEWVRNNIEFVPTYGSIQGANMCLQSSQCNDMDTASLLIALLRVSNIPAHYVYGTIEVPMDKVMNWAGGFTDPNSAVTAISSGGIPSAGKLSGSVLSAIQMEHVWVEAYIPYGNYRGAIMDQSNKTWIPMDGSFKQYTYTNGFDMTATVPFSQDTYLSQVQSQNPVLYNQSQIQAYLDANMPNTSLVDVKGYRQITAETYHFLPSTPPYVIDAVLGKYSAVPAGMAATATFTLSDPATGSSVSYTDSTYDLAGKRVTVSYLPATTADEALIASYGGFLYDVPAYMLNLVPVIKVEGAIQLTGEATTLGSGQNLTIQFAQPSGINESINKNLIAGAYYAVGVDLQGINENVLGKRNYNLTTNVLSQNAGTLGNDDLIGEHLHILMTTYFLANDKIYKSGAKLYNTTITRTLSEGITSFTLSVASVFLVPTSATPSGINIDVAMDRIIVIAKDGDTSKEKACMDIAGLVSSYHEHDIFEKIDGFSSVSAVRALQVASANGIAIQKINSSNIAQILPALQVGLDITADIQNAVNAGKEVTIPQANVQINDWNGTGYIVKDPLTGSGAYMISGGLAGGE